MSRLPSHEEFYSDTLTQCTYCRVVIRAYSPKVKWVQGFPYCEDCAKSAKT